MTIREDFVEHIYRIIENHEGPSMELAEKLADEWYDTRADWIDKLIDRSEGDIDLLSFLADKYPDGDEDRDD